MNATSEALKIADAAQATGASPSGIRKYVQMGEIPHEQEKTNTGYRYMVTKEGLETIRDLLRNGKIRPSRGSTPQPRETPDQVVETAPSAPEPPKPSVDALEVLQLRAENKRLQELLELERERRQEAAERAQADRSLLERALAGRLALPPHEEPAQTEHRSWWRRLWGPKPA